MHLVQKFNYIYVPLKKETSATEQSPGAMSKNRVAPDGWCIARRPFIANPRNIDCSFCKKHYVQGILRSACKQNLLMPSP